MISLTSNRVEQCQVGGGEGGDGEAGDDNDLVARGQIGGCLDSGFDMGNHGFQGVGMGDAHRDYAPADAQPLICALFRREGINRDGGLGFAHPEGRHARYGENDNRFDFLIIHHHFGCP